MNHTATRDLTTNIAALLMIAALLAGLWLAIAAVRHYTAAAYNRDTTSAHIGTR